ncbi:ABC transporter ATP-binding protein [Haloarcula sp. GH36]|uniref:ABC transporter ATP-binding protein n=1 Tax=Haloarcula montana TaxID=3111776 RepID=UPI002D7961CA|nr:ABC transporter ATP-binding protein [Haloarcula sp. GH36]
MPDDLADLTVDDADISQTEKKRALLAVINYRPILSLVIVVLSIVVAVLEGVGIGFLMPIISAAQSGGGEGGMLVTLFTRAYTILGIPYSLGTIIAGVGTVMAVRFGMSFLVAWLKAALRTEYVRHLQTVAFENTLQASVEYFDQQGSDEILNAIVTQATYAGRVIEWIVQILEKVFLCIMYIVIAMYLAPVLTVVTGVVLGGFTYFIRSVLASGYEVGDDIAEANEQVQSAVQAGTHGIRDVKVFGMTQEVFGNFLSAVEQYAESMIELRRNQAALDNFYQMVTAITVFVLIFVALQYTAMTLSGLAVYLFAMFRLAPRVSALNNLVYKAEGELPHMIRTQQFIDDMQGYQESNESTTPVPESIETVTFDSVSFAYEEGDTVLDDISFEVTSGEFAAFVGTSGAGKSTIISLLSRMYTPDTGAILADGTPITDFDINEWREKVSIVRQDPFIFNETLRYNLTIGNRDVSEEELQRVISVAKIDEFLNDLPDGLEAVLGDEGARLSGGQRQRIAIARALLKDCEVLLLDEATSDLDSTLEQEVHEGIISYNPDLITLVVAHRLSTVKDADKIYTVESGRLANVGTHDELIKQDGKYAELYSTQI